MVKRLTVLCLMGAGLAGFSGAGRAETETEYAFGPESTITYHVGHPIHGATGVSHALTGTVRVRLGETPSLVLPLRLSVPIRSFQSGNRNRDRNMLATMNAARYSEASLVISAVTWKARQVEGEGASAEGTARGVLTLRGTEQPVEIPVTGRADAQRLVVTARFSLLLSRFGVERPSLLLIPIDDRVPIEVSGVALRR